MPELLPNWRSATAADGKEYYFNELTGETSWTFPTADAAPAEHPPAASPAPPADLSQAGADALSVAVDVAPPIVQTFRAEADSPALGVASSLGGAGAHTHGLGPTHGLGGGLTFSTPNVLKALEGKLFQLISLFLSSFVLLLVACIDYGGDTMYVSGVKGEQQYAPIQPLHATPSYVPRPLTYHALLHTTRPLTCHALLHTTRSYIPHALTYHTLLHTNL